jgi:hypothetical protein
MSNFEQRPVLGLSVIGGKNSVAVTLYAPLGEGFVPLNRVPRADGTTENIGSSRIVDGISGREIAWSIPVGPTQDIYKLVSDYINANGATPDALRRLQMLH